MSCLIAARISFSVINSITRLSLASAISIETAKDSLIGRLEALQRTYSRLTDAGFEGERLKEILDTELEAFEGRVQATGAGCHAHGEGGANLCAACA